METDFHLICEDSRQFDFLLGWTLFKELSMRNACDTAPLTSLSFRELPKITKLHLEIFRVNRLLENQLETVAKSEFNLLSRPDKSVDE